ncbi:MAG: YdeI/OmpD-associated family protein [Chloroflexota bacterium]|nr:YdeI/OmpD-associated family protein [Chloroflexota bacterium]
MDTKNDLPIIPFASRREWEEWLDDHHVTSKGLWLKIAKKGSGIGTVTYAEALDIALCYGWIDGQKGSFDDTFWLQRFTPRGPKSKWSKVNRDRALDLIQDNRMKPAGLNAVDRARADGRWDQAYDPQSVAVVPEDLQVALDQNPGAAAFFTTLDSANRYAVLYRIQDAKKLETRARRIEQFVAMLSRHEKLHP